MDRIENAKCSVWFDGSDITGYDKTDVYNGTTFFTRNKRGLSKGWETLKQKFNNEMSMYQAMQVLNDAKLNCHSFCSVD